MFNLRWLYRFVRRRTNPIPEERAERIKRRLSIMYMLISWNAFGFVCYMCYTGRSDWARYYGLKSEEEAAMSPAQQWARTLKIDKAKIVRIKGFHVEDSYDWEANQDTKKELPSESDQHTEEEFSSTTEEKQL